MNFWNSRLDKSGTKGSIEAPNQKYVVKTIYDPSPAGIKYRSYRIFWIF